MTTPTLAEAIKTLQYIFDFDGATDRQHDAWAVVKAAAERGAIDTEIYDEVREQLEELEDTLKPHMTANDLAWARGIVIGLRYKREAREAFPAPSPDWGG